MQNLGNLLTSIVSFSYEADYPGLNKKLLINKWEDMDTVDYDILALWVRAMVYFFIGMKIIKFID